MPAHFKLISISLIIFLLFFSNSKFYYRVPWSTTTYLGFYFELSLQMFTVRTSNLIIKSIAINICITPKVHFYMLIFSSTISIFYAFHKFIDGLVIDYAIATNEFNRKLDDEIYKKSGQQKNSVKIHQETHQFLTESVDLHLGVLKYSF